MTTARFRTLSFMLTAVLALTAWSAAGAERPIVLHRNPSEADWHFLFEQLGLEGTVAAPALADDAETFHDRIADLISRGVVPDQGTAIDYIREVDVAAAWADLTGDGIDEAIVVLGFGIMNCGTAGCGAYVLQRRYGGWAAVMGIGGVFPDTTLCYKREALSFGSAHYPVLRSSTDAIWWTGKEFHSVCYEDCEGLSDYKEDTDAFQRSLTDEERILPEQLRDRPWYAPVP